VLDLSEDDPLLVSALISYLYRLDYDEADTLPFHLEVSLLADKYDIDPLQQVASAKFERRLHSVETSEAELVEAASLAYEITGPTQFCRSHIIVSINFMLLLT
jgi:hypothetical protein